MKHDPFFQTEDKKLIEERLAQILLNGFGEYLRNLNKIKGIDCNPDEKNPDTKV